MTDTTTTRPMLGDTLPKALEDWQALYVKTRGERDTAREAVDQIEQTRDDFGQQLIEARREIDRLRAVNAAQSDMLKGAALAAAEVTRERDALRKTLEQMPKYQLGQTVSVGEWSPSVGTIEEIRINDDGIEYSVYVDGESMAYTWSESRIKLVKEADHA